MISPTKIVQDSTWWLTCLGVAFYAFAMLITLADIFARQFGQGLFGVVDIIEFCVVAGAFCVLPYTSFSGKHVSIDIVVGRLGRRFQSVLLIFTYFISLGIMAPMLWYGVLTAQRAFTYNDRTQSLGMPVIWFWVPLIIGLTVTIIVYLALIVRDTNELFGGVKSASSTPSTGQA
jgi:TRAP-type C4-dicarboxylate transport system permease small subunit